MTPTIFSSADRKSGDELGVSNVTLVRQSIREFDVAFYPRCRSHSIFGTTLTRVSCGNSHSMYIRERNTISCAQRGGAAFQLVGREFGEHAAHMRGHYAEPLAGRILRAGRGG